MTTIRQERASELLYQELSILIGNELEDPALELLTVTNVIVSRDLRVAKIYVHQDSADTAQKTILARLKKATPFLRRQLAQRVNLRAVPELFFYYDDTPAQAARVDELLRRIAAEREQTQPEADEPQADGSQMDGSQMDGSQMDGSQMDVQKEDA